MGVSFKIPWHQLCTFVFRLQVPNATNTIDRFCDWQIPNRGINWWSASTSDFYALLAPQYDIISRGQRLSNVNKSKAWWNAKGSNIWSAHLELQNRLFLWRVLFGVFPLLDITPKGFLLASVPGAIFLRRPLSIFFGLALQ